MGVRRSRNWTSGKKQTACWAAGGVELNVVIVAGEGASMPSRTKTTRAKTTRAGDPYACAPHFSLCVYTTQLDRVRYPADGQHVCRDAVVDVMRVGEVHDIFKSLAQDEFQLLIHGGFLPEITLTVLHPLKVRSGNAAGVGENVW